jgi:Protein of unknown function (DUF2934)
MKTLSSTPPLPIILDTPTSLSNTSAAGFESMTNPGGPAHEEIRHRAYSIWECAGRPANREVADWLAAEAEVTGESDS